MPHNVIVGINEDGFKLLEKPQPEFIELVEVHDEFLTALLLDKPILLQVQWEDGDAEAVVSVIPADRKMTDAEFNRSFETFKLAFPDK